MEKQTILTEKEFEKAVTDVLDEFHKREAGAPIIMTAILAFAMLQTELFK